MKAKSERRKNMPEVRDVVLRLSRYHMKAKHITNLLLDETDLLVNKKMVKQIIKEKRK